MATTKIFQMYQNCYKWFQDNTTICLDGGDNETAFSTETQVALGKSGHISTLFCLVKKLVPKRFNTKKLYSNALRTVKQKEQNFISVGQGLNWVNWGRYPIQQGFETNLENQRTIELGLPNPRYREAALLEKCSIQGLLKTKLMRHTCLRFLAKTSGDLVF